MSKISRGTSITIMAKCGEIFWGGYMKLNYNSCYIRVCSAKGKYICHKDNFWPLTLKIYCLFFFFHLFGKHEVSLLKLLVVASQNMSWQTGQTKKEIKHVTLYVADSLLAAMRAHICETTRSIIICLTLTNVINFFHLQTGNMVWYTLYGLYIPFILYNAKECLIKTTCIRPCYLSGADIIFFNTANHQWNAIWKWRLELNFLLVFRRLALFKR